MTLRGPAPAVRATIDSGLGSLGARLALVVVWLTGVAQSAFLWPGYPAPVAVVVILAVTLVGVLALTVRDPEPLPLRATLLVAPVPVINAAFLLPQLGPGDADRTWPIEIGCYLAALLPVRGRRAPMLLAGAVTVGMVLVWGSLRGVSAAEVGMVLVNPVVGLIVGYLWAVLFGRIVAEYTAQRGSEARSMIAEAAERAAVAERRAQVGQIAALVRPFLLTVRDREFVDAERREAARLLEARIRDRLRAPSLAVGEIERACVGARRRGVEVLLLDDGDRSARMPEPLTSYVAGVVDSAAAGRVTVRTLPPGRSALATLVVDDGTGGFSRVTFDRDGGVVDPDAPPG